MKSTPESMKRSRTGCWTCRKRKKKCDDNNYPCKTCYRLNLTCDRDTKLIWEDDTRRDGMKRRGPSKLPNTSPEKPNDDRVDPNTLICKDDEASSALVCRDQGLTICQSLPNWKLNNIESSLLEHYVQRFCQTYPTCRDASNPFLSILLPIAMSNDAALNAILALSGAQLSTDKDSSFLQATLRVRHRALQGLQRQLAYLGPSLDKDAVICALACCVSLLLYEKLAGHGMANWMPHLLFLSRTFDRLEEPQNSAALQSLRRNSEKWRAYTFTRNLFLYNDLVQSTATGGSTLSDYYVRALQSANKNEEPTPQSLAWDKSTQAIQKTGLDRFYYPFLVAQISSGKQEITPSHIDLWDGRLDWFPSYSLSIESTQSLSDSHTPVAEEELMSSIYRHTAKVYMHQMAIRRGGHDINRAVEISFLASQTAQLISQLPKGSTFENTLLWPIGIIGPELLADMKDERIIISQRLQYLCIRFGTKHFQRMQEVLRRIWEGHGLLDSRPPVDDVFLFG